MKLNDWAVQWIVIVIIGLSLIVIHGFWNNFLLDYFTLIIFVVIAIPTLSVFLKRAKIGNAEFEFREEIQTTKKAVKESVEKAKSNPKAKPSIFETFNLYGSKNLLSSDPVLALASLRIELEKKLNRAMDFMKLPAKRLTLSQKIEELGNRQFLTKEQITAFRKIIDLCNKAVHGYQVSKAEAKEIIDLADDLNKSFYLGYSINFTKNSDYKKQGLMCEWEHCIENMPLTAKTTAKSCPIFGHNCPEGPEKVSNCEPNLPS